MYTHVHVCMYVCACAGAAVGRSRLESRLESCRGRWEELYEAAGQDVPDPWLGPSNPLNLPGVEWVGIEWM
jgi:hypothetical protein